MNKKLNLKEECDARVKKANRMLRCIKKGISSRDEEVIHYPALFRVCQDTPGMLCLVLVLPYKIKMWTGWRGSIKGP